MLNVLFYRVLIICSVFIAVNGDEVVPSSVKTALNLSYVCSDYEEIPLSSLTFPPKAAQYFASIRNRSSAKAFYSRAMISNWEIISSLTVQGLNVTVTEVLAFLRSQGCYTFPWGGSIRDLVLGHFIADIDAEVTCDPTKLWKACDLKFGEENCQKRRRGNAKLILGNFGQEKGDQLMVEPIDIAHWNATFGSRKSSLEYTANSLSYFPDTGLLIDISGKAIEDICSGKIRIPARKQYWIQWRGKNTIDKLLRYWTLRSKGFTPASESVRRFVFQELRQNFDGAEARRFLCHKFFEGKIERNGKCQIFSEDHEEQRKNKLHKFLKTLEMDFGSKNVRYEFRELFEKLEIVLKY